MELPRIAKASRVGIVRGTLGRWSKCEGRGLGRPAIAGYAALVGWLPSPFSRHALYSTKAEGFLSSPKAALGVLAKPFGAGLREPASKLPLCNLAVPTQPHNTSLKRTSRERGSVQRSRSSHLIQCSGTVPCAAVRLALR